MDTFEPFLEKMESDEKREKLRTILQYVSDTFPSFEKRIAWNQPMFTDHGTFIVGFSVAKNHLSVAPEKVVLNRFSTDIRHAGYDHSKMLMKIKWEEPVDYDLLKAMIEYTRTLKKQTSGFWYGG